MLEQLAPRREQAVLDGEELRDFRGEPHTLTCLCDGATRQHVGRNWLEQGISVELPIPVQEVTPFTEEGGVADTKRTVQVPQVSLPKLVESAEWILHGFAP